ncbi:MAG: demethoxyubiquinone hydroxylase family protein [SAR86 cluster bacterium]|jgi:3-demethoxyubiquinol 3-hydroxylase|tara:strand:+ start:3692 stop:4222 length:531 start_codon:yes stop_codon:yes gene_type:complete
MAVTAIELPIWLEAELRSDQAGETGAVWIYRGVLATQPGPALRQFCLRHLATEQRHLAEINALLPPQGRSLLLPIWRIAGFLTGFLPACVSERSVYLTVAAVETFVQAHYQQQIVHAEMRQFPNVKEKLAAFMRDEIDHKDEAANLAGGLPGAAAKRWCYLVGAGSKIAVRLARRV